MRAEIRKGRQTASRQSVCIRQLNVRLALLDKAQTLYSFNFVSSEKTISKRKGSLRQSRDTVSIKNFCVFVGATSKRQTVGLISKF